MQQWRNALRRTGMPLSEQPAARPRTPNERETPPESGTSPVTFTIVAAATAPVRGGVGILRGSRPAALPVSRALVLDGPQSAAPRRADPTMFYDRVGTVLDQCQFIYFQNTHAYTARGDIEYAAH